ncbi:hypothetical protein DL771_004227 [Monosporascus sp. 5C6A]|nr:hypothetical protein DL771_004227 [Monosporascus sp. 5C6A]
MFWQPPIIRVLHSGRGSVTVIFIMSGYLVAVKTVSEIHKRQLDQVLHSLWGPLFRRSLRLYIPIVFSTLIVLALIRFDLFQPDPTGHCAPPRAETLQEQLHHCHGVHPDSRLRQDEALGLLLAELSVGSILFIVVLIFSPPLNLPRIAWWRRNTNITTGGVNLAAAPPASVHDTLRAVPRLHLVLALPGPWGRGPHGLRALANPAIMAWPRMDTADAALTRAWRDYCAQALCAALLNRLLFIWVTASSGGPSWLQRDCGIRLRLPVPSDRIHVVVGLVAHKRNSMAAVALKMGRRTWDYSTKGHEASV